MKLALATSALAWGECRLVSLVFLLRVVIVSFTVPVLTPVLCQRPEHNVSSSPAGITRCRRTHVEIVVSPLVSKSAVRELQFFWETETVTPGDWVGFYFGHPLDAPPHLLIGVPVDEPLGWHRTVFTENHTDPDQLGYHKKCLGYWVAYYRAGNNDTAEATNCLHTNPRWMEEMKPSLSGMQLRNTFLPGTHDSGAYTEYDPLTGENLYQKYVYTQDETILGQMIYGARYFDLRVGNYNRSSSDTWWVNHGLSRTHPLREVIHDIKQFLDNTQEIILLDFHEFPVGFKSKKNLPHDSLVKYLLAHFRDYLVPASVSWAASVGDIWNSGRRLIISYNDEDVVDRYGDSLWLPVHQKWGNVQNLDNLKNYLDLVVKSRPAYQWAAMAQMTPRTMDVILNRLDGLRKMAHTVNGAVTMWFRGSWGRTCNIVAVDFLRSTGVVEAAIQWNKRRSKRTNCDFEQYP